MTTAQLWEKAKAITDIQTAAMWVLFLSDAGHTGAAFSVREQADRSPLGYVVALSLDLTAAASLHRLTHAHTRAERVYATGVFILSCGAPIGFGYAYYRATTPTDHPLLSLLFGSICPVLAGAIAGLRALAHARQTKHEEVNAQAQSTEQAQRQLELDKYRIEQEQETARVAARAQAAAESEKARALAAKARADARAARAKVEADGAQAQAHAERAAADARQAVAELGSALRTIRWFSVNPMATQAQAAADLGICRRTVGDHLKRAEEARVIKRNGQGIQVLVDDLPEVP